MSHENKNFGSLIITCLVMYLFAEFDDAANLLAANPDATTISIDEPIEIPKNQHGRLQEPGREEDDELLGTDDSDKTEVRFYTYSASVGTYTNGADNTEIFLEDTRDSCWVT